MEGRLLLSWEMYCPNFALFEHDRGLRLLVQHSCERTIHELVETTWELLDTAVGEVEFLVESPNQILCCSENIRFSNIGPTHAGLNAVRPYFTEVAMAAFKKYPGQCCAMKSKAYDRDPIATTPPVS